MGTDKPLSGREYGLNRYLAGRDGLRREVNDALGRPIEIRDSRGNLAMGRLTGNARISLGATTGVRGSLSFSEVDLRSLIGQLGSTSQLGSGRLPHESRLVREHCLDTGRMQRWLCARSLQDCRAGLC